MHGLEIGLAGERVVLSPRRALWWPSGGGGGTLFVADVHLGKASAFAAGGLPLAADLGAKAARADVARLEGLVEESGAARVVVLGDLLHARAAREAGVLEAFAEFRKRKPGLEVVLVRGNHDRQAGDPPASWGVAAQPPGARMGPFVLCHEPAECAGLGGVGRPGAYGLCGHVHPAVAWSCGAVAEKTACFWETGAWMVLPAFGRFTGTAAVRVKAGERAYLVGAGEVVAMRGG